MNSHRPNKRARAGIAITLFALSIFVCNYLYNGAIARVVQQTAAPILSLGNSVVSVTEDVITTDTKDVQEENTFLRSEVARLADIELENKHLRDALAELSLVSETTQPLSLRTVAVPVVARAGVFLYGTLAVENNTGHSFAEGARVYGNDGIVIGTIKSIAGSIAQVQLLSVVGGTYNATVTNAEGTVLALSVVGKGHGNFIAYVPRDASIPIGTLVYTDATGFEPIGVVAETYADPADSVRTVRIHTPFVIEALRFVRVEK